jgi:hypothetical protein
MSGAMPASHGAPRKTSAAANIGHADRTFTILETMLRKRDRRRKSAVRRQQHTIRTAEVRYAICDDEKASSAVPQICQNPALHAP